MKNLQQTPLLDVHLQQNGKLVDFAGWQLPISFAGTLQEHTWTRNNASLFDIGHMAIIDFNNAKDAIIDLEKHTPADLQNLTIGSMRYGVLTNTHGGIIDDFMATRINNQTLRIIANASRRQHVLEHFNTVLSEAVRTSMSERRDLTLIAIQGPASAAALAELLPETKKLSFLQSQTFTDTNHLQVEPGKTIEISRSGYTGEDGFELALPNENASNIAKKLLQHETVQLAGLGARDTLRLEAGLCLYGNDLDETISPIEANLHWTIPKNRRTPGAFAGSERILRELAAGTTRKRVGITTDGRKPIRSGATLSATSPSTPPEEKIGTITSGTYSPTIQKPVAMGYIDTKHTKIGTQLIATVRGKELPCIVTTLPFVAHNYHR